jgi:hypothetical protein
VREIKRDGGLQVFELLAESVRKNFKFKKEREFFVGREAFDLWNAGVRLTIGASSPQILISIERRP